jgi:hypothetical protein
MDADDLLSRRFLDFCASSPGVDHCAIDRGFVWESGSPHVTRVRDFHRVCGSSLASYIEDLPEMAVDHWLLRWGHNIAIDHLSARGDSIAYPKFPAAIYRVATGENWTGLVWSNMGNSKKFRSSVGSRVVVSSARCVVSLDLSERFVTKHFQSKIHR